MNLLSKVLYNKMAKISKEPGRRPVGLLAHWCGHWERPAPGAGAEFSDSPQMDRIQ